MRIECPKFKKDDGVELYVIIDISTDYRSRLDSIWRIGDVMYRYPPKRKWTSFITELSDNYQYRGMSYEEKAKKKHEDVITLVGKDKIKEAFEYAWQYIKPDVEKMLTE